jgi:alanyl-tRNA synthetase
MKPYQKPFLFEIEANVKNITEKNNFLLVELDKTNFYPGGGGQPYDTGSIENENYKGEVIEVEKQNNKIIHKIKTLNGSLKINDNVNLKINKPRRISLIKMHTGEHILFKSLEKQIPDLKLDKINLDENESSLFVKCKNLDWEILFKAEDLANKIIHEDKKINIKYLDKEQAAQKKELRIKLDRIEQDKIRVIEIQDFDLSACTGIHAENTGFVKNIIITSFNKTHGSYEIRFITDAFKKFIELAKVARKSADILNTDVDSSVDLIKKILQERDQYKEKYRSLLEKLPIELKSEKINNITFKYKIFDNYNRKKLIDTLEKNKQEKTVVLLINKTNGNSTAMLSCSDDLDIEIPEILKKALEKFNGKGGGRDRFAQGGFESKYADELIEEVKNYL